MPRFGVSKTETFFNSIYLAVINKYDKDAMMELLTVLGHVYHLLVEGWYETGTFKTFI